MTDNKPNLDAIRRENPFISSSVGNPWEHRYLDVESINSGASEGLRQLIGQKTRTPSIPCAGLVFGEVGSGKTHLISRILQHGKAARYPFTFAYIQPIEDPDQTYRYLLREVMVNLCYPVSRTDRTTQLDIILEKILAAVESAQPEAEPQRTTVFDRLRRNPAAIFKKKRAKMGFFEYSGQVVRALLERVLEEPDPRRSVIDYIRLQFPEIPKTFLRVLFQYPDRDRRSAVVEWLKGTAIDEADAALLGVEDRTGDSVASLEQTSRYILHALGLLLSAYGQPLVVCFDRLENYDTDDKIRSFGKMVELLVDNARAMLPVAFVRSEQWEDRFIRKLNHQVVTRLRTNEFRLKGCDADDALAIIRARLGSVLGKDAAEALFPFDPAELREQLQTRLHSPREVIMLANSRLNAILYPDKAPDRPSPPASALEAAFESQLQEILADFDRYPPDRNRTRRAVALFLANAPATGSLKLTDLRHPDDEYVDLECRIRSDDIDCPARILIDMEQNHASVRASLKRGIGFFDDHPDGRVIYIRDARYAIPPPPNWQTTNALLDQLRAAGGAIFQIDRTPAAEWTALALLSYAVKEGDITVRDGNGTSRAITESELGHFVRDRLHGRSGSAFQSLRDALVVVRKG